MTPARTSIRSFLAKAKSSLHHAIKNRERVTLVIGNESAADIKLRPELLALLRHANLTAAEHLITLDDLATDADLKKELPPEHTKWLLVDHNVLQGTLGSIYASRAVGVIDHHVDEHRIPPDTGDQPRVITESGSCSSLVVEYLQKAWDGLSEHGSNIEKTKVKEESDPAMWDAEVAKLALASILIDTGNLTIESKVTLHDKDAVGYLESKLPGFDRKAFYNEITDAKQNIDSLPLHDILRKDYKEWNQGGRKLGIACAVKPLEFLMGKAKSECSRSDEADGFITSVEVFAKDRSLSLFAIMTAFNTDDDQFHRELFVWALNEDAVSAARKFEALASNTLGLDSLSAYSLGDESKEQWRKAWNQKALQHSRKALAPLLREAMQ